MIYQLGSQLQETTLEDVLQGEGFAVFLTSEEECPGLLETLDIHAELDISLSDIRFCKVESQQECLYGTFAIPRLLDILGSR